MKYSTHFIYGYMVKDHSDRERGRKEIFYLRLYGVRHMVKDRSDRERGRKEIFYLRLYGVRHMVKDRSDRERGRKEGNVFIYGYMASDIW